MKQTGLVRLMISVIALVFVCYNGLLAQTGAYTVVCVPNKLAQQAQQKLAGKWQMSYSSGKNTCFVKFTNYGKDVACIPKKLAKKTGWAKYTDRIKSTGGSTCYFNNKALFATMQKVVTTAPKIVNSVAKAEAFLK